MDSQILTKLFWEYRVSGQELQDRLDKNDPSDPLTVSIYNRLLLNTPNWYNLLKMLSKDQLRTALSPAVIKTIHSKALRERFSFVYQRLFNEK